MELSAYLILGGALAVFLGFKLDMRRSYRARDNKPTRPRIEPFDDAGGYAAHGDWPFVPGDLKSRFHGERNTL